MGNYSDYSDKFEQIKLAHDAIIEANKTRPGCVISGYSNITAKRLETILDEIKDSETMPPGFIDKIKNYRRNFTKEKQ